MEGALTQYFPMADTALAFLPIVKAKYT